MPKSVKFSRPAFAAALLLFPLLACGPSRIQQIEDRVNFNERPPSYLKSPLAHPRVLSNFGRRGKSFHTGIDIRSGHGKNRTVAASAAGRVVFAGKRSGYGKLVEISHEGGYRTRYAHLKKFLVAQGSRVVGGQAIGVMGRTGRASAIHLHFEVISPRGDFLNPGWIF